MSRKRKPTHSSVFEMKELERQALEAQADELLRKADHDLLVTLAENMEAIRVGMESLKLPSNDPEYLKKLQVNEAARNAIANRISQIDIVPDGQKSYIGIGSFKHHEARELALLLSSHLEAKIRQHE
jgi:hypothetical protein